MPPGLRECKMQHEAEILRNSSPTTSSSNVVRENFASRGTTPCHFVPGRGESQMTEWGQVVQFDARARLPADADVQPETPDEFSDMLVIESKDYLVRAVLPSSDRGRSFKVAMLQARGGA
jgi:hypothetical protein